MTYYARTDFMGVIDGEEKIFAVGDAIPDAQAKEMNLAAKPDLASTKKEATVEAANP